MVDKDPQTFGWAQLLLSSAFVSAVTFIGSMVGFRARATERDRAQEKELETMQKDINRLESGKAGNDKIDTIWAEIKRMDGAKAEKEAVNMLMQTVQSMDVKLTKILTMLAEKK